MMLITVSKAFNRAHAHHRVATALHATCTGLDVARLVAQEAACVYVCAREWSSPEDLAPAAVKGCANVHRRGMITGLTATGEGLKLAATCLRMAGNTPVLAQTAAQHDILH
jgi:hypothetical protein